MEVTIGVSNRHVHLTKETYIKLFGNEDIEKVRDLNQPGQFASNSFVDIKNGEKIIKHVRILGPFRDYNQVEISKTDSYTLKLDPPVRASGDIKGSSPITIVGPNGEITLSEGCIIAERHIHMLPKQAEMYGFEDKQTVSVILNGEKGGIINNVHIKVADESYFEMHLDTDDANAHMIKCGDIGTII